MFEPLATLALGLVTGIAFGFLLQRGQVAKFKVIVGQFLLRDFTMMKVMVAAIIVGAHGIFVLTTFGYASLHIKTLLLVGVPLGAAIFAVGMVLLGYCPGTGVAAAASGSRHAWWGMLGMLFGAALYAEVYPLLKPLLAIGDVGKVTLPGATGVPAWLLIFGLTGLGIWALVLMERWETTHRPEPPESPLEAYGTHAPHVHPGPRGPQAPHAA